MSARLVRSALLLIPAILLAGFSANAEDKKTPPPLVIEGMWQEGPEANGIRVNIVQTGEKFAAVCVYKHPKHGDIQWEMKGTVSKDGEIRGQLTHTKAPQEWANQVRVAIVSVDGKTITGRANLEGKESHDFVWRLVPKADSKHTDPKLFVGKWRIVEEKKLGGFEITFDASFTAKTTNAPNATGVWEVVGNEARITWNDGWKDVIRLEKDGAVKVAFEPRTTFTDKPVNTQKAVKEPAK